MLKKTFVYMTVIILVVAAHTQVFAGAQGVVNVKKLNVRIRPTTKYSITGVLNKGDKVNILKREGDWYMISAPSNSSVWVSKPFIEQNTITKRVNLRCGPSVAFMKYTAVNPGMKVKVLDDSQDNWVKIAPPNGLAAYVSTQFVTIVTKKYVSKIDKPKPKKYTLKTTNSPVLEKKKTVAKKQKTSSKISNKFANMSLEELLNYNKEETTKSNTKETKNNFVKQIKKTVSFQGYLLPLSKATPVATHCIAIKVHDKYIKTCFIYTDNYNLNLWENRKVSVKGVQHWVKGWVIPVVEAESIRPVWNK